jgi:hypothetical protein
MTPADYKAWFGTVEFFEGRCGWYFLSPDGLAVGPYENEQVASRYAARLAKILKRVGLSAARNSVLEFVLLDRSPVYQDGAVDRHRMSRV